MGADSSTGISPATAPVIKTPRGIFALALNGPQLFRWTTLSDSYISGLALRGSWSNLEVASGVRNFAPTDGYISLATAYGKYSSLSVAAGDQSPAWLLSELTGTDKLLLSVQGGAKMEIPMPWSATYQSAWGAFLASEGARYDGNSDVTYVTMSGFGNGVEPFLIYNETDYATFTAAGGFPRWETGAERMIDQYAAAFPTTPFIFPLAELVQNCTPDENAAGQAAMMVVANYGLTKYPGRFLLGNHGLQAVYVQPNWRNTEIAAYPPGVFQLVSDAAGDQGHTGNLSEALNNGVNYGGVVEEVYPDYFTPGNTATLTTINNTLLGE